MSTKQVLIIAALTVIAQSVFHLYPRMAWASSAFEPLAAGGQVRHGVIGDDDGSKVLYVTQYDRNEVSRVDLAARAVMATVPVGKGPSALAISHDGAVLACIDSLANTVSLIRVSDMTLQGTVTCGKGPCDITALPGGGFAVANSFSNSVTLINPQRPDTTAAIDGVAGVPTVVAASNTHLAVGVRVPPALHLFAGGAHTASATVPLPGIPTALAFVGGDQFVVGTRSQLLIVNGDTRNPESLPHIVAQRDLPVIDLAIEGDRVFVLTNASVEILNLGPNTIRTHSLEPVETFPLTAPGYSIVAGNGLIIVPSPKERACYVCQVTGGGAELAAKESGAEPAQETVATPAAQVQVLPPPEPPSPQVVEVPISSATAVPVEVFQAQSPTPSETCYVQTPAPTLLTTVAAAESSQVVVSMVEPTKSAAPLPVASLEPAAQPAAPAEIKPPPAALRKVPLGAVETQAPSPVSGRPSAAPTLGPPRKRIEEGLLGPAGLGLRTKGLQLPDWTRPLDQLDADVLESSDGGNRIHAKGNVVLRIENTTFTCDEFFYDKTTGEMHALGNVQITQEAASLFADDVRYTIRADTTLTPPAPLTGGTDEEQDRARRALMSGKVEALNLRLEEPYRSVAVDRIQYDFAEKTGEADNLAGHSGVFYLGATKLRLLGPADAEGEDIWVTTCDHDPPHYRIRLRKAVLHGDQSVVAAGARFQLGGVKTPIYWPRWAYDARKDLDVGFEFRSGHRAALGYYVNTAQYFAVTPDVDLGVRFFPTTRQGVGLGLEAAYDFTETPTALLFGGAGTVRTLYTTQDRGEFELYHRHELTQDTVLLLQAEQWYNQDFYRDFHYDEYKNRTEPRTFANITYAKPTHIATATVRQTTNNFVAETERAPEVSYHLLERRLTDNLYFSFDTIAGYNEREPSGDHALRSINVGRVTLDLDLSEAWNLAPFAELEGSWYSDEPDDDQQHIRLSANLGTTLQSRFHRAYPGRFNFSGFKHVVVPSITMSYRPEPTMEVEETPRFDAYDNVYGRARIESKIDNIVFGRDAETSDVWQVARLTLYQGSDLWNEMRQSQDYELEFDFRPRPWWGYQLAAEHHSITGDFDLDAPYGWQRGILELYELILDKPYDPEKTYKYNARYGDYDRILTYLYYDDRDRGGKTTGRLGFAYTKTQDEVFNREILYGAGYRLSDKWAVAFEHRYDFERGELARQKYELRRNLHCWEGAIQFQERETGWDIGFEISLTAFPATRVRF